MRRTIEKDGLVFDIANYRPRRNEYEKGLKYQILIRVFDSYKKDWFSYRSTGVKTSTIKEAKDWINKNYFIYL